MGCLLCLTRSLASLVIEFRRSPRRNGSASISVSYCTRYVVILTHHHQSTAISVPKRKRRQDAPCPRRDIVPYHQSLERGRNVTNPIAISAWKGYALACAVSAIMGIGMRLLC